MDTLTQGIELQDQGKFTEALPFFKRTVEEHPESYIGWTNLSETLLETGQYREALQAAEEALKVNPRYAPAWVRKARALNRFNPPRSEEGIAACDRAIQYDPNFVRAYLTKGEILYDQERGEEALAAYESALRIDSNSMEALFGKASTLGALGDFDKTYPIAERMIQLNPQEGAGWRIMAFALYMMKERIEALQAIGRALAIDPNDSAALTIKSSIVYELGHKSEARALAKRAAELDPENELAQMSKAEYDRERNEKIVSTTAHVAGSVGRGLFAGFVEFVKAIFQ
jgi:tetratricopeptide (TPR) repeat protein